MASKPTIRADSFAILDLDKGSVPDGLLGIVSLPSEGVVT
jgi:hypothetical protein